MKRFFLAIGAGLVAAAMATPSFAADLPRPAPVFKAPVYVAPLFTWSGFYVGLNGGYAWGKSNYLGTPTGNFNTDGWLFGGTLGYNLQTGNFVWGLEGDIDYSSVKGSGPCGISSCQTKLTWLATTRGRIGYAFDRFLPYVTGGAAFGGVEMTPPNGKHETDTRIGWTLGAGLEWAFLGAWSAKLEYLYADLGKANCSAGTCGVPIDVTYKTNIVRGGVNYRF